MGSAVRDGLWYGCPRDGAWRPAGQQECDTLSLTDSERLYSVELDRDMILCVEPRQKRPDGPNPNPNPKQAAGPDAVSSSLPQDTFHPHVAALERQRRELLDINRTWDEQYGRMKRHYEAKIQQLLERLAACDRRATEAEEELERKHRDFGEKMLLAKETVESAEKRNLAVSADLQELERRMRQLRLHHDNLATRGRQQGCEIRRLNKALQDSQADVEKTRMELEVLRYQAKIYKTDFTLERQDKEHLKTENLEMKKKMAKLQAQVQKLRSQAEGQQQPSRPCACPSRSATDSSRT